MTKATMLFITVAGCTWAGHGDTAKVGVFVDFDTQPNAASVKVMKKEVEDILRPTGVAVNWRELKENKGNEAFSGVVVMRFHGKCQVQAWSDDAPAAAPGQKLTLGRTLVAEGHVLPYSEIECDQVRQTLPGTDEGAPEQERKLLLGRALGRVVAHELYHVLAATTVHAGRGLAKATQPFRDMVSGALRLTPRDANAIRFSLFPK